jgi:ornithine cyclodeaminase
MLVISEKDILQAVSLEEIMGAVEKAFLLSAQNSYVMPARTHVEYNGGTLLFMPCAADGALGTKYLTLYPSNIARGMPTIYGLMILNDADTGKPLCVMDGRALTALRTGAVGGVGLSNTTPEDIGELGLVGAGEQGFYQLLYASRVRPLRHIYVYDVDAPRLNAFVSRVRKTLGAEIAVEACSDPAELLRRSQAVITTTTSRKPVLPNDAELLRGRHFIGIGSYKPFMKEYPDALFHLLDAIFIDTDVAIEETGDIASPLATGLVTRDQILNFGKDYLSLPQKPVASIGTTLFKSVGMALFDLVVANMIYRKAMEKGIGASADI